MFIIYFWGELGRNFKRKDHIYVLIKTCGFHYFGHTISNITNINTHEKRESLPYFYRYQC